MGFVVREYEAQIGEEVITTPHINITQTHNGGWSQMGFQLGIPFDAENKVIPAGSTIQATVEYLIPPADKSTYYGPSDYLNALPAAMFQSTDMILELATGNHLVAEATTGTLLRTYPLTFQAVSGATPLEFSLTGGRGYTPLVIKGLPRVDGWTLERKNGENWEDLDQEVHGKDYWQAYESVESGDFELTFNLKNSGTTQYRLRR